MGAANRPSRQGSSSARAFPGEAEDRIGRFDPVARDAAHLEVLGPGASSGGRTPPGGKPRKPASSATGKSGAALRVREMQGRIDRGGGEKDPGETRNSIRASNAFWTGWRSGAWFFVPGPGADPFGDLLLDEEDAFREQGVGVEGLEQDGRGDRIGEVPDELGLPRRPARALEKSSRSPSRGRRLRRSVRLGPAFSRRRGTKAGVLFDGDDAARPPGEEERQGALARRRSRRRRRRFRGDRPDDLVEDGPVDEEMLAEGVAPRSLHRGGTRLRRRSVTALDPQRHDQGLEQREEIELGLAPFPVDEDDGDLADPEAQEERLVQDLEDDGRADGDAGRRGRSPPGPPCGNIGSPTRRP